MTKKERTIKACRELAAKYREPKRRIFFAWIDCSLCHIHKPRDRDLNCRGCPLAEKDADFPGCYQFKTAHDAKILVGVFYKGQNCVLQDTAINKAFNARAAFFDKIIPILEGIPASRFTQKGWKYFDELDRSW